MEGDLTEQFTRRSLRARNSQLGCAYASQGGALSVEEEDQYKSWLDEREPLTVLDHTGEGKYAMVPRMGGPLRWDFN